LSELEFLDAAALAALPAIVAAFDKQGKSADDMARVAYGIANAMRIERSLRHQAIDPTSTRLRR
jgi:hypothetical protein